jgi:hypothetical protein
MPTVPPISAYAKFNHKVRINYYPPRGDTKEGWDNSPAHTSSWVAQN